MAFHIMEKLSTNHLKHFMEPTMEKTAELLDYIFPLLDHLHPELCDYIEKYVSIFFFTNFEEEFVKFYAMITEF